MFSFIFMIVLSLGSMAYGFVALFKKDWLWKLRGFSASVEGKAGQKRDEDSINSMNRVGNLMGVLALILGAIGFFLSIAAMYIYIQSQAGALTV